MAIDKITAVLGEVWKPIDGFPNYEVSNLGNVKSLKRDFIDSEGKPYKREEKFIKPWYNYGYVHVNLYKNEKSNPKKLHRLIAIAFIPNPENKRCVNHINGIKDDNRIENLEWATHKENVDHAVATGLTISLKGEYCHKSKLSYDDVTEIFNLRRQGVKVSEIMEMYSISQSACNSLLSGRTWKSHHCNIGNKPVNFKIEEHQALEIIDLLNTGISTTKVAKELSFAEITVRNIRNGKTWKHLHHLVDQNKIFKRAIGFPENTTTDLI